MKCLGYVCTDTQVILGMMLRDVTSVRLTAKWLNISSSLTINASSEIYVHVNIYSYK